MVRVDVFPPLSGIVSDYMLIWIHGQLKHFPESLIINFGRNVIFVTTPRTSEKYCICYIRTIHIGNNTNSHCRKRGILVPTCVIHFCIYAYVLCNEKVMYVTFTLYSSGLKDTFHEKESSHKRIDGYLVLNVKEFPCPNDYPNVYLHGVLLFDGNNN